MLLLWIEAFPSGVENESEVSDCNPDGCSDYLLFLAFFAIFRGYCFFRTFCGYSLLG